MRRRLSILLTAGVLAGMTFVTPSASAGDRVTLTLVTHDSFSVSTSVLGAFTRQTGISVKLLPLGDAGAALNQVILTKDNPVGDLFFGVDNTFLTRALRERIFVPYESPALTKVPDDLRLDSKHRVTPVDYGDVCVNDDKTWLRANDTTAPKTLRDLTKPSFRGRLVVQNPATSSPGLAFMLATIAEFGPKGWLDYWRDLRDNDVKVVAGWEEAYNGEFTAGEGGGDRPLVVSYASSPPAAVYFSDPQPSESPIGTMLASCFRQIETVGILRGTEHVAAARKLVDFMLSERFQADVPLQMFVFPAREGTPLPEVFTRFADVPEHPLSLPARQIGTNRERWIDQWTDVVLR
jgi:thiamine transport system substrate-binding protein